MLWLSGLLEKQSCDSNWVCDGIKAGPAPNRTLHTGEGSMEVEDDLKIF